MKILRDYQNEGISAVNAALLRGLKSMIACFATGLGKTLTAIRILHPYKRALWLTHREELIIQSAKAILAEAEDAGIASPSYIGIVKQERFEIERKVVVASVQTMHNRLDKISPNHFDVIIVDECHLAASKSFKKILDHFQPKLKLGLTATPHRLDGLSLGDIFEEIVIEKDIAYGIGNGYLVELDGIVVKTSTDLNEIHTVGGDLNQGELERTINTPERNKKIAQAWMEHANGKKTIGFCTTIQHAIDLCDMFRSFGIKADFVCSDKERCPDRKERLYQFTDGDTMVMFNVDILTVGFDFPPVACCIMACPTKSLTKYLQSIGRGTRAVCALHHLETAEQRIEAIQESSKPKCIILDIVDITGKHALVNTWTLDKDKPIKDKIFKTREFKEAEFQRIRKLEKEIEKTEKRKLLELPKIGAVKRTANTLRDATEKQLAWLKKIGYDVDNNTFSVADCMEIIGNLPATEAQIWRLKKEGYNLEGGATRAQADAVITEVNMKRAQELESNQLKGLPFSGLR